MYSFNSLVPTKEAFSNFFGQIWGIEYTSPEFNFFFDFMKSEFGNRFFRWNDIEDIKSLCYSIFSNAYYTFKHIFKIESLNLDFLISDTATARGYVLPGDTGNFAPDNIDKYLSAKQLNMSNKSKLDLFEKLGSMNLLEPVRKKLAKCFVSFY